MSGKTSAMPAMPALPGAASTRVTGGACARRQHSACSRPPPPTTRTSTSPSVRKELQGQTLLARRPDADHRDRHAAQLLEEPDVALRLLRKIVEGADVADLVVPAGHVLP